MRGFQVCQLVVVEVFERSTSLIQDALGFLCRLFRFVRCFLLLFVGIDFTGGLIVDFQFFSQNPDFVVECLRLCCLIFEIYIRQIAIDRHGWIYRLSPGHKRIRTE